MLLHGKVAGKQKQKSGGGVPKQSLKAKLASTAGGRTKGKQAASADAESDAAGPLGQMNGGGKGKGKGKGKWKTVNQQHGRQREEKAGAHTQLRPRAPDQPLRDIEERRGLDDVNSVISGAIYIAPDDDSVESEPSDMASATRVGRGGRKGFASSGSGDLGAHGNVLI
ncbi:hypothetical protein B0H14DRAFT_2586546 [Mycena olivaceomarginata]|nr:hypothetical protein B0H14DRAFT_2586546 [Mycena olivaceomarginata]